ncbi:MAG: hypothetical protein PHW52_03385 [Candidatus Pacebacteria bacterium]|nr:hypothetical protein [Candidatus Paceibacterota bacterium]
MPEPVIIIDGPDKWDLVSSFADRRNVEFRTENSTISGIVDQIQHEDGSRCSFNIILSRNGKKDKIHYDTRIKRGRIVVV